MKQLQLTAIELLDMGFKYVLTLGDDMNTSRPTYEIKAWSDWTLYFSPHEKSYTWYLRATSGSYSNSILLNIESESELLEVCKALGFKLLSK